MGGNTHRMHGWISSQIYFPVFAHTFANFLPSCLHTCLALPYTYARCLADLFVTPRATSSSAWCSNGRICHRGTPPHLLCILFKCILYLHLSLCVTLDCICHRKALYFSQKICLNFIFYKVLYHFYQNWLFRLNVKPAYLMISV